MLFEYQLSHCQTMYVHCLLLPGCYQLTEKANSDMKLTVIDCNLNKFSIIQNITITARFRNHNQLQLQIHNFAVISYNYIIGPSPVNDTNGPSNLKFF